MEYSSVENITRTAFSLHISATINEALNAAKNNYYWSNVSLALLYDNSSDITIINNNNNNGNDSDFTTTTTTNNNNNNNNNKDFNNVVENVSNSLADNGIFNITAATPIEYAMVMYGYIMPVLLILTIVANTLIVLVLSQKHMRTPTNLVLLSMAIADMLTLLFPSPWYLYMYTFEYHRQILYPPSACYAYYSMIEVIPMFFHTASIWLTILLAGQRYIYICHPVTAKTWCTIPRVMRATISLFILAFSTQFSRFFDYYYIDIHFERNQHQESGCQQLLSDWVQNIITPNVYFPLYYGFRIIFVHIGPCAALVVLNVLLFRALIKAQKKRKKLFQCNRNESKKLRDSNSTTYMLIVVVTVFLMVEIPMACATLTHVLANMSLIPFHDEYYKYLKITILVSNFIIMLSFPLNFAIYCGMSRQFRQTFMELFVKKSANNQVIASAKYSAVTSATNL